MVTIDKDFPIFLLCGVVIGRDALNAIKKKIKTFTRKYFGEKQTILHSKEIRNYSGRFWMLYNQTLRERFLQDLTNIFEEGDYRLIACAIQKEELKKKYRQKAKDPYVLSLKHILETLVFYLEEKNEEATAHLVVEARGVEFDKPLRAEFNSLLHTGTSVEAKRFRKRIKRIDFIWKRENTIGLQLSDICAYPLARHILCS